MPASCWGCGQDWRARWKKSELASVTIDGEKYRACPDCLEEMASDEDQVQRLIDGRPSLFEGSPTGEICSTQDSTE